MDLTSLVRTSLTACALALLLPVAPAMAAEAAAPAHQGVTWERDYKKAAARAKAEGKDLFLNFTGSDWCGYCLKLEEQVFTKPGFAAEAERLLRLRLSRQPESDERKALVVDAALRDQLIKRYEISGLPALMVTCPNGMAYGALGYEPIGEQGYIAKLRALRSNRPAIMRLAQLRERSTLADLRVGVPAMDQAQLLGHQSAGWLRAKVRGMDPQGSLGLRRIVDAVETRLRFRAYYKGLRKPGAKIDWLGVHRILGAYPEADLEADQGLQEAYVNLTYEATLEMIKASAGKKHGRAGSGSLPLPWSGATRTPKPAWRTCSSRSNKASAPQRKPLRLAS